MARSRRPDRPICKERTKFETAQKTLLAIDATRDKTANDVVRVR